MLVCLFVFFIRFDLVETFFFSFFVFVFVFVFVILTHETNVRVLIIYYWGS